MRPVVRGGTDPHVGQTRRQEFEGGDHLAASQQTAHDRLAERVGVGDLKPMLASSRSLVAMFIADGPSYAWHSGRLLRALHARSGDLQPSMAFAARSRGQ